MSEPISNDWVVVDNFIDVIHADIVRGRLEAEGIPAILGNRHLVTAEWLYSQAMGGVQIMVAREQVDQAREVIGLIDSGGFAVIGEELRQEDFCSVCGTALVRKTSFSWKVALLIGHFLFLPLPFNQNKFYCPKCLGK